MMAKRHDDDLFSGSTMTFGEHLEETADLPDKSRVLACFWGLWSDSSSRSTS